MHNCSKDSTVLSKPGTSHLWAGLRWPGLCLRLTVVSWRYVVGTSAPTCGCLRTFDSADPRSSRKVKVSRLHPAGFSGLKRHPSHRRIMLLKAGAKDVGTEDSAKIRGAARGRSRSPLVGG